MERFRIRHDYIVFDETGLVTGSAVIEDIGMSCQQSFKLSHVQRWRHSPVLRGSEVVPAVAYVSGLRAKPGARAGGGWCF
jgi:hypothetical protein